MLEMKESRATWLDKIPITWSIDKLKFHLQRNEPRNPGGKQVLSLYRDLGVVPKDSRDDNYNVTSEDTSNYKYVRPGDLVINKMKAWQGSVAVSDFEGIVSPAYYVYTFTDNELIKKYFHYLLRGCYKDEFMRLSGGIRVGQWDLPSIALDNTLILIPPIKDQISISDYLDRKCAEIDNLTTDIEAEIETLEQYKQSVITEAVTKGLNPDVEMKDSGIEWIGEIPQSWDIGKVSFFYDITLGKMVQPTPLLVSDSFEYYICAANLGQNKLKLDDLKQMWMNRTEKEMLQLKKGDLVVVEGGDIASCDIVPFDLDNIYFQNSIIRVRGKKNNENRILRYILIVSKACGHIDLICNKATIAHFTKEKLMSLQIPIIPISEQTALADYLDNKCEEIDSIITDKQAQLETLTEYKKSLIYEYVTGKKEVPTA